MPQPIHPSDLQKKETPKGFVLVNRRLVLSETLLESLTEAAAITGLSVGELRIRVKGPGIGALNINRPLPKLEECAAALKAIGINAGVVEKDFIKNGPLPQPARHLDLSADSLAFLDADKNPLLTLSQKSRVLIILTDLSGQAVRQIMTAMAYTGGPVHKEFDETLKKISITKPAAIFYDLNGTPENSVYVDSDTFSYLGLNEKLTPSKGSNFRVMIHEAMALASSSITDENFGIALLPGASPEWSKGKPSVEKELCRYGRYVLAAVKNNLLPFTPEIPSSETSTPADDSSDDAAYAGIVSPTKGTPDLPAPPDMSESRLTELLQSSLPEIILILLVPASPFSLFMAGVNAIGRHADFWKASAGFAVTIAGFLMFCYAFVLFYYRRMVENTPTSKIRSLSMGMVELSGKAQRCYDLKSSATKTRCVYYRCRYYRYEKSGDTSRWVKTRDVSSGGIPFYLEDDTGRVLIHPKGAVMQAPMTVQSFQGSYIPTLAFQMNDPNKKVVEELIPEKARLYVLGSARIQKQGRKLLEIIVDKLRTLKQSPTMLSKYDVNGDGKIDGDEWESARDDAERMAYAEALARGPEASEIVVVGKPRIGLLPFIIADSEQKLTAKLLWLTLLYLAGGAITMGFGINFLINFFK